MDGAKDVNAELLAGREVTREDVQAAVRAMTEQAGPLHTLDPPEPVEVWDPWHPGWWPGLATHWRGDRVNVRYSSAPGLSHLVWLPADAVRRVEG